MTPTPACTTCGKPATQTLDGKPYCAKCAPTNAQVLILAGAAR